MPHFHFYMEECAEEKKQVWRDEEEKKTKRSAIPPAHDWSFIELKNCKSSKHAEIWENTEKISWTASCCVV